MGRASATETVRPAFLLEVQLIKGQCEASSVRGRQVVACLKKRKVPSLSPDQGSLVNKMQLPLQLRTLRVRLAVKRNKDLDTPFLTFS